MMGSKDHKGLLLACCQIEANLSGAKITAQALNVFAQHLIEGTVSMVDFTVQINATIEFDCLEFIQPTATKVDPPLVRVAV